MQNYEHKKEYFLIFENMSVTLKTMLLKLNMRLKNFKF